MRKSFEVGAVAVVVAATAGEPSEGVRAGVAGGAAHVCCSSLCLFASVSRCRAKEMFIVE